MAEISEQQQFIYNTYLKYLAKKANRPYAKRKNLDGLNDDIKLTLSKLEMFFNRNQEVNIDFYFRAGFEFTDHTFLSLGYFDNISVIRDYKKLQNKIYNQFVDSDECLDDFKTGLQFITKFCNENKLYLTEYINSVNESNISNFLLHLKLNKISFYHLHALGTSFRLLPPEEIINIYVDEFKTKFFNTQRLYKTSSRLKQNAESIINYINTKQTNNTNYGKN